MRASVQILHLDWLNLNDLDAGALACWALAAVALIFVLAAIDAAFGAAGFAENTTNVAHFISNALVSDSICPMRSSINCMSSG